MKLTKRDIALTKINVPSSVQSIYFQGKRYTYKQYLKIISKNSKDTLDAEKIAEKNHDKHLENLSNKQKVDHVIKNFNHWKKSRPS